jgi:hypothetical protein
MEVIRPELLWRYTENTTRICCGHTIVDSAESFFQMMPRDTRKTNVQDILDIYFHGSTTEELADTACCGRERTTYLWQRGNFPSILPPILMVNLSDVYDGQGAKLLDACNMQLSNSVMICDIKFHLVSVVYHIGMCTNYFITAVVFI